MTIRTVLAVSLLLVASTASAAIIEAKTELHALAHAPIAKVNDKSQCVVIGAVVVNGELSAGADVGLVLPGNKDFVARGKTNAKGVYELSFKASKGTKFQEVVVSNPDKAGKAFFFPGAFAVCS